MEVPTSVSVPPKIAENDSGIRRRDGATPTEAATDIMIGVSKITTGVLFMKAEAPIVPTIMSSIARRNEPRACRFSTSPMIVSTPVRSRAAEMMNIIAMVIGAEELNTVRKSRVSMIPVASSAADAASAVTSGGYTSLKKLRKTTKTRARTKIWSRLMSGTLTVFVYFHNKR